MAQLYKKGYSMIFRNTANWFNWSKRDNDSTQSKVWKDPQHRSFCSHAADMCPLPGTCMYLPCAVIILGSERP